MTKKNLGMMILSALIGFLLAVVLYHPSFVKAQSNGGLVKVRQVSPPGSVMLYSGRVVGFSCTESVCYIASVE